MRRQWIATEHYRLHIVEGWPDSPYKEATLRGIRSALASLGNDPSIIPACPICSSRRRVSGVVRFPSQPAERAA